MGNLPLKGSRFEIICSDENSMYFLERQEGEILSTICMQNTICLFFFFFVVSALLHCLMSWNFTRKLFDINIRAVLSLYNTNLDTTSKQVLMLLPLIPKKM